MAREKGPEHALRRSRLLLLTMAALVLAILVPLGMALFTDYLADEDWGGDDWGALAISMWLGVLFFGLAWYVERDGDRRAEAVANAELITSMGFLDMSAARSFAGHDHQALRIAADARAALQQYASADSDQQKSLIETVENSYSDLAFGTFARADALPRSMWNQLCLGAEAVQKEADTLAAKLGRREGEKKAQLAGMAAHVRFVQRIGQEVRQTGSQPDADKPGRVSSFDLDGIWTDERRKSGEGFEELPLRLRPAEQLDHLERLYRRELTVVKQWDVLRTAADAPPRSKGSRAHSKVSCSAVLIEDLDVVRDWYAPWYVKWDLKERQFKPVNVQRQALSEAAATDTLVQDRLMPVYPAPLQHGSLPEGLRTTAIANLCRLLHRQMPTTVCVLVYDMVTKTGRKRLVLDGNHRLAAALSVYDEFTDSTHRRAGRADSASPVRVLAFIISEHEPIDDDSWDDDNFEGWEWKGFTPDIGLIRGSWLPRALRTDRSWYDERPGPRDHVRWAVRRIGRRRARSGAGSGT